MIYIVEDDANIRELVIYLFRVQDLMRGDMKAASAFLRSFGWKDS